jgi:hypothetical protein
MTIEGSGKCCEICWFCAGKIEYVYHGGKHGALFCARGHKLTGKDNDLKLFKQKAREISKW